MRSSKASGNQNLSLNDSQYVRYSRQMLLSEVGESGMALLRQTKVLIIGAGGLGQLAAQYLCGAGIGHTHLVDPDRIELSNLPRQLLYQAADTGQYKALTAERKLAVAFTDVNVSADCIRFDEDSASKLLKGADIVLDCSDNFSTRQLVNASCVAAGVPLVMASVTNFDGQLLLVDMSNSTKAGCYHCLFPEDMLVSQNCVTQGVLGSSVGVMASMQVQLTLNYLLNIGSNLANELHQFNAKTLRWTSILRSYDSQCPVCCHQAYHNSGVRT